MRKRQPTQSVDPTPLTQYRSDTIYEDQSGYFVVIKGERLWFDSISLAQGSKKYKRLFVLYSNTRTNGQEYML
jgi:hypothetical protein